MLKFIIWIMVFTLGQVVVAQEDDTYRIHIVQKGDTFESIAAHYDTCAEVIVWENNLVRAGLYSSQFIVKAGTTLRIPPRSACDDLPQGEYIHIVESGDTVWGIMTQYCSYLDPSSWSRPLEVGDRVTVNRVESTYQLDHQYDLSDRCIGIDHLIVYDDSDLIFYTNETFHVQDIAACYGVSGTSIIRSNPGEFQDGNSSLMGSSRSYVIPDASQECMFYEGLTTSRSGEQVINQTYACYPQSLEQMAGLPSSDLAILHFREETGNFCYTLEEAYTILLDPLNLDWFKWDGRVLSWEGDNWRQESIAGRQWENLARCMGVRIQEIREVNGEIPYSSEVFPPLPAHYPIYYVVPKPRRSCYLFNQEILQTQRVHVVQEGETLSVIAAQYDLFTSTLAQANGIENKSQIYAGEWLLVPDHPTRSEIALIIVLVLGVLLFIPTIITLYHRRDNINSSHP